MLPNPRVSPVNWSAAGRVLLPPVAALSVALGSASVGASRLETVTFSEHVAPILFARCAPCHRPEGVAPFPLLTYDDVKRRAQSIAEATADRAMPPWPPEPGYGEFAGERRLSTREIETIQRWVRSGAPEGDRRKLPPPPAHASGWHLGEPDLVVTMAEPYLLPAGGHDLFRTAVLPVPITATRYVRAIEFRPGNPRVVHHAIVHVDRSGASRGPHPADQGPAAGGMIFTDGDAPEGHFLGWSPGQIPTMGPEDLAWPLEQGSSLIVQLHLMPAGRPETIQASVGLFFAKGPPARVGLGLQLGSYALDIPPGDPAYVVEDAYALPVDVELHAIYPHAHYLGKEIQAWATLPDGTRRWLIWIRRWDFDWQGEYRYATPVVLPKGTTIAMRFTYDNSAANPRNPATPPRRVRYGGGSSDEMANLWMQVVPRTAGELAILRADAARKAAMRHADGYRAMLEREPGKAGIHRALGFAYLRAGEPAQAWRHLADAARLAPQDASVHYALGNLEAGRRNVAAAAAQFRRAIELQPDFAEAVNNLGVMVQILGDLDEALRLYREAVALDPDYAEARNNLGVMLQAQGRLDEAIEQFREALRLRPDYELARENLDAAVRARKKRPVPDPPPGSWIPVPSSELRVALARGAGRLNLEARRRT